MLFSAPMAPNTREQILNVAEPLFAEKGFNGVGVREITQRAGVNVAAIHYHFGSKEELFVEVIGRHVEPMNRERIQRLRAISTADPRPPFEEAVRALYIPVETMMDDGGAIDLRYLRMAARVHIESPRVMELMQERLFGELRAEFSRVAQEYFPGMPEAVLRTRCFLVVCLLVGLFVHAPHVEGFSGGAISLTDFRGVHAEMVKFAAAGFAAPFDPGAGDETA